MNDHFNKIPNIGSMLADKLSLASISSIEELRTIGSREAFLRLQLIDPTT